MLNPGEIAIVCDDRDWIVKIVGSYESGEGLKYDVLPVEKVYGRWAEYSDLHRVFDESKVREYEEGELA